MDALTFRRSIITLSLLLALPASAFAHLFLHHSVPAPGSTVSASPERISIWFDGELEGVFSRIHVRDSSGNRVNKGDSRADPSDKKLLTVSLPRLSGGTYRVDWAVTGRDGHRSQGDFEFIVN